MVGDDQRVGGVSDRRYQVGQWTAGVGVTTGATAIGIVSSIEKSFDIWPSNWMIVPAALIVLGLVLMFVPLRRRRGTAAPGSSARESIQKRARDLSTELYRFTGDAQRNDPVNGAMPPRHDNPEVQQAQWDGYRERITRYHSDTVATYNDRFAASALAIYDEAVAADLADGSDRHHFEHPANRLVINDIAQVLGTIGHRPAG